MPMRYRRATIKQNDRQFAALGAAHRGAVRLSGSGKEPDIGVPRRSSRFRADLMLAGHEAFHHA
jgi:hypothetical protein